MINQLISTLYCCYMDIQTDMTYFVTFLLFIFVSLMIGGSCSDHSLDKRANVAKRIDKNSHYNIYTKINSLEKDLSNLETKLQKRTKLLRQVLRSVIEMDSNVGLLDKSPKKQTNLASKKNGNLSSQFFFFISLFFLFYFHQYWRMNGAQIFEI